MPRLKDSMRLIFQKALIVILGLLVTALFLEGGIRLGGFVYRSIQGYSNWRAVKKSGTYRILCIGESTTKGQYPKILERILNKQSIGIRFSIMDKGRVLANTRTILNHLEEDLAECRPNMVIAMMGINDGGIKYYQGISTSHTWFFKHCRAYKFLQILWMNLLKKIAVAESKDDLLSTGGGAAIRKTVPSPFELEISNDYFQKGQCFAKQGNCWLAKSSFEKSIALDPENDRAYVGLGVLFQRRLKDPERAAEFFNLSLKINPRNDQACSGLGWIFLKQGEHRVAEDFFNRSLEINPKNDEAYLGLAAICLPKGDFPRTEKFFEKALELKPKNGFAISGLGTLYRVQGDFVKAEKLFKKALVLDPGDFRALTDLVWIHRARGEFAQARGLLEKVTGLGPERNERLLRALVAIEDDMNQKSSRRDEAAAVLDKDYSAITLDNYRQVRDILGRRGTKLICVQYPTRSLETLTKIFGKDSDVVFVDNDHVFRRAVKKDGYAEYFIDMFAGDFGHCTRKGNELLAQNIADVILREVFHKK